MDGFDIKKWISGIYIFIMNLLTRWVVRLKTDILNKNVTDMIWPIAGISGIIVIGVLGFTVNRVMELSKDMIDVKNRVAALEEKFVGKD